MNAGGHRRVLDPAMIRASGALLAAETALGRRIQDDAVAATGHDPTVVDLLTRLDQAPENRLRAVELSRQLLMSPSHISRVIDRAEAAGLVERCADPLDRRASQVAITAAGHAVIEDFAPRLRAVIDAVIHASLSPAEVDTLVDLLGRIETTAAGTAEA